MAQSDVGANPQLVYQLPPGTPDIAYNDLPVAYQGNIEFRDPFTPVPAGTRMTPTELQDLVTFLCTLSDGFDPSNPDAYVQPAQCANAVRR